jgi:hypothetical protein
MAWSNISGPSDVWVDTDVPGNKQLLIRKNGDHIVTKSGFYIRIGIVGPVTSWTDIVGPSSTWNAIVGP